MKGLEARIGEYLRLRRAMGFKLERDERLLFQFASYLKSANTGTVTVEHVLAWAVMPGGAPEWHAARLRAIRGFLHWAKPFDPDIEVPAAGLLTATSQRAIPYLYTDRQIQILIEQAAPTPHRSVLKAATYSTLIGLLACTGMRIGEAIGADWDDLAEGVLTIADTKFGKTRLVPLHPTAVQALIGYRQILRRELKHTLDTGALFVSTAGTRLLYKNVHFHFHRLTDEAGITARSTRCRPRIHDLRHTFAVNTLAEAYRNGDDPARTLTILATYLGHISPSSTYWYLQAAPQLLAQAAGKMQAAGQPRATGAEEE